MSAHRAGRRKRAVAVLAALAFASCGAGAPASGGSAATGSMLFVDQRDPRAGDAHTGRDSTQPLRTIAAGVAKAVPGDTVRVAAGIYREAIAFQRGGTGPDRMIHVVAADGADVTVKGSDVVTGWTLDHGAVWRRGGWTVNSQQVFADGQPLRQIGVASPFNTMTWGDRVLLPPVGKGVADMTAGSFFFDASSSTLYAWLPGDADPNGHVVEASVRDDVLSSGAASFVELRGLKFAHSNGSRTASMRGIVNVEGSSWTISGCSFTYGDFVGLSVSGNGHRVSDSVASHNGDVGIVINGSDAAHDWAPYAGRPPQDLVLERDEASQNNYRGFYKFWQGGGLKASNSCNGVRISQFTARANDGSGIWFDLGCTNVVVERSTLQDNGRGIEYEISDHAVLSRNLVTGSLEHGIFVNASSDVSVVNNTLDGNRWGIALHGEPRPEHPTLTGNAVTNNIVGESASADLVVYTGDGAGANTSDYNLYYRTGGGVAIAWTTSASTRYAITHRDLGGFASETGQDAHSITGDPRWVAPSSGDFRLLSDSPAIGKGRPDGATAGAAPVTLGAFPGLAAGGASASATPSKGGR